MAAKGNCRDNKRIVMDILQLWILIKTFFVTSQKRLENFLVDTDTVINEFFLKKTSISFLPASRETNNSSVMYIFFLHQRFYSL